MTDTLSAMSSDLRNQMQEVRDQVKGLRAQVHTRLEAYVTKVEDANLRMDMQAALTSALMDGPDAAIGAIFMASLLHSGLVKAAGAHGDTEQGITYLKAACSTVDMLTSVLDIFPNGKAPEQAGVKLLLDAIRERAAQVREGKTAAADFGRYTQGQLRMAAAAYALCDGDDPAGVWSIDVTLTDIDAGDVYPWEGFKPKDGYANMVRAIALLLAEADRAALEKKKKKEAGDAAGA